MILAATSHLDWTALWIAGAIAMAIAVFTTRRAAR